MPKPEENNCNKDDVEENNDHDSCKKSKEDPDNIRAPTLKITTESS